MEKSVFDQFYSKIEPLNVNGGIGDIFRAQHLNLNKTVILKKIKTDKSEQLLDREVKILKNLKHEYLPVIYDFIVVEGVKYVVEE